jgi:hypothetical protein
MFRNAGRAAVSLWLIQVAVLGDNAAALGRLVLLQLANIGDHVFHAPRRRRVMARRPQAATHEQDT